MFEIQTQRLTIRDMLVSDAELFVGLLQDKEYQRFYSEADCRPEHYRHLAQLFIAQSQESPRKAYQLAITCKTSGEFIGIVCLRLELEHQASLGFGLKTCYQGKAIMREAVRAILEFAFTTLGVHRVYAETISKNLPAVKLCLALGMRQEACFVHHRYFKQQWWDTVVLAMREDEWKKRSLR